MYGYLQRPDKGTGSLGVRVTGGSKLSEYSCWDRNTGLLNKQQAPFTAEPCVRSRRVIFVTFISWWGWKSEREEFDFSIQLCLFPFSLCSSGMKPPTINISTYSVCYVDTSLCPWGTYHIWNGEKCIFPSPAIHKAMDVVSVVSSLSQRQRVRVCGQSGQ